MLTSVALVSHRRELTSQLRLLLDDDHASAWEHHSHLGRILALPRVWKMVVVDVLELLQESPTFPGSVLLPPDPPRMLIVGYRGDAEAIRAALAEGIHVYLLEDLTRPALARITGQVDELFGVDAEIATVHGHRVLGLLAKSYQRTSLTRREGQILELLRQGMSNQAIATRLQIEEKTVKNHLTRLYEKLGVAGRYEAIAQPSLAPRPRLVD